MNYLYLTLGWVFGILAILAGLAGMVESILAGLFLVAAGLLLLPPVRVYAYTNTNLALTAKVRVFLVFALFSLFSIFTAQSAREKQQVVAAQQAQALAQAQAERAAAKKQEMLNRFSAERAQIIAMAKETLTKKDYKAVVAQTAQYLTVGDEELNKLHAEAASRLEEVRKANRTTQLLAELKTVSAKEYEKNRSLYQQLLDMHPDNDTYKTKVASYAAKAKEEAQKQQAAAERQKRIDSLFSAWDGSLYDLERVIKDSMNDPDSYDHDKTVYWDMGSYLVVKTTFRGKNAFGGMVKNYIKAKVSLDGKVLQIIDQG